MSLFVIGSAVDATPLVHSSCFRNSYIIKKALPLKFIELGGISASFNKLSRQ